MENPTTTLARNVLVAWLRYAVLSASLALTVIGWSLLEHGLHQLMALPEPYRLPALALAALALLQVLLVAHIKTTFGSRLGVPVWARPDVLGSPRGRRLLLVLLALMALQAYVWGHGLGVHWLTDEYLPALYLVLTHLV